LKTLEQHPQLFQFVRKVNFINKWQSKLSKLSHSFPYIYAEDYCTSWQALDDQDFRQIIACLSVPPSGLALDVSSLPYYRAEELCRNVIGKLESVEELRVQWPSLVDPKILPSKLNKISLLDRSISWSMEEWLGSHRAIEELAIPVSEQPSKISGPHFRERQRFLP
jgi:hypothetical protein